MSASLSTLVQPALAGRSGTRSRLFVGLWSGITDYFIRRTAITTLRELDDRALQDIGISRSQIEAAVRGFIPLPDQARMS